MKAKKQSKHLKITTPVNAYMERDLRIESSNPKLRSPIASTPILKMDLY